MKKTIVISYFALFAALMLPRLWGLLPDSALERRAESLPLISMSLPEEGRAVLSQTETVRDAEEGEDAGDGTEDGRQSAEAPAHAALPKVPESITVLRGEETVVMATEEYLLGVLAAEMPASFPEEALKAQAVAARTFAMYCAAASKHAPAQVCTDFACCQAWQDEAKLRENWGEDYEYYRARLTAALSETAGQYLSYGGQAIFAAFHSSSAGSTADCGELWQPLPYLKSVSSPENGESVPNFESSLVCAPLDFRDTLLYAAPYADFSGEESTWLGPCTKTASGRVKSISIGGVSFSGAELRGLFSLRSAAFELEYADGLFKFTVSGYGHGVGMSQYGAKVLADGGEDYRAILAHYYQGAELVCP